MLIRNQCCRSQRLTLVRKTPAVVILAIGVVVSACSGDDDVADGPAQADIDGDPPYGLGAEVGETYDYTLYTHCGIEWARIDGVWWQAPTPLDGGNANPPPGWGNPYDDGELEIVDETRAIYRGGAGEDVEFERTDLIEPPFSCA